MVFENQNDNADAGATIVAGLIIVFMFISTVSFCVYAFRMWKKNQVPSTVINETTYYDEQKYETMDGLKKKNDHDEIIEASEMASNIGRNVTKMDESKSSSGLGGKRSMADSGVLDMNAMAAMMRQIH